MKTSADKISKNIIDPKIRVESAGPPIKAIFYTQNDKIYRIVLENTHHNSLCWEIVGDSSLENKISGWIASYLQKKHTCLPLDWTHIPSTSKNVLEKMLDIPFGGTLSYQELAILVGFPTGARAMGQICRRNPFPLVIPCHRIISTNGSLRGFAFGLDMKKSLLEYESI